MEEKILTQEIVIATGWNELETITADMIDGFTKIGDWAFVDCNKLTSITIPNSVTSIGYWSFLDCDNLTSITIPNSVTYVGFWPFIDCGFKVERRYDEQGRLIAYKGFDANMTCRGFKYEEGKTYEVEGEIKMCRNGIHACVNPLSCLNHYWGEIGRNAVFHEVYLEGVSDEYGYDSKVVARKITIGREVTLSEMADIASGKK